MAETTYAVNLINLIEDFGSEDKCRDYLEQLRWPSGPVCPRCNHLIVTPVPERNQYSCDDCGYVFSVTSGTIMHDTHLPLWKWFLAVYMIVESKKGVSANQLKRTLKVSYKTAWYLCHRIRKALETPHGLMKGIVEIDETFVGGKLVDVGKGNYRGNKTLVVGAAERGGGVVLKKGKERSREELLGFAEDTVSVDAEAVYTDELSAYRDLRYRHRLHDTVNHSIEEWVRGDVHTNTIEGAWSLFKRSLVGSYHKVSQKHLGAYLDEFEFRYNNRKNPHIFREAMRELVTCGTLEYKELVDGPKVGDLFGEDRDTNSCGKLQKNAPQGGLDGSAESVGIARESCLDGGGRCVK